MAVLKAEDANKHLKVLKLLDSPSGFSILPIHWSHDPEKDDDYIREQRAAYDRDEQFQQEMELDFSAQLGAAAYPSFTPLVHIRKSIKYSRYLPLCLALDFNVQNLNAVVCQIRNGVLLCIEQIYLSPGNIPDLAKEFRNLYPDHPAGVHVYGDSNGLRRTVQTEKSDYDLFLLHMSGYPSKVEMRVSRKSPNSRDRINSLNHKLKGIEDKPMILISQACQELIDDLHEVVMRPDGKDVLKTYNDSDPYSRRTHASDALGYLVHREWPIIKEALRLKAKQGGKRKPLRHGRLLGQLE